MQIALASLSQDPRVSYALLQKIADAVERQLYEHYAPFWQGGAVPVKAYPELRSVPPGASPCILFDHAEQAGILGYHDVTPLGLSYSRVFVEPILASGGSFVETPNSVSVTVSHEVLETVGDPYANLWALMRGSTTLDAVELCDRCEADAYEIDGVMVSNFLGPRAFRDGPGPYDWMRLLTSPWEIRPGGYAIRMRSLQGSEADVYAEWGDDYPEWRKGGKLGHAAARTARRLASSRTLAPPPGEVDPQDEFAITLDDPGGG